MPSDPKQPRPDVRNSEVYRLVADLFYFFKEMRLVPVYFFLAVLCSFAATFFNFFGLKLLIPLLQGLLKNDFTSVGDKIGVIRFLSSRFPEVFDHSTAFFFALLGVIFLAVILKNFFDYISALGVGQQIRQADANIRKLIVNRFLDFGKLYYDRAHAATTAHILMNAAGGATGQLMPLHKMLAQILSLIAYLSILAWISWKLTIVVLVIFPLFNLTTHWLVRQVQGAARAHELSRLNLLEKTMNVISCIGLVKAYAHEHQEKRNLGETSDEEIRQAYQMQKKQQLIRPIQDVSTMTALFLVVTAMLWLTRADGAHAVSSYLVFFYIVRLAMPNFNAFSNFKMSLARAETQIAQLRELLLSDEGKFIVRGGEKTFGGLTQAIQLKSLSFAYRDKRPVLWNLSFSIERGRLTAIVGPTGAGKTTLAHLLMRFYDCAPGQIFLDGTDMRDFSVKSLMDRIAFVGQDPMLFNDTLRSNITYGLNGLVTEGRLHEAVEKACLADLVQKLPEGLDTKIGDRGIQLSGGERQRAAIARAFLKDVEILILDEATSALDTKTERSIQQAIDEMGGDKTVLVIAHRLSTITHADKIVVMEQGQFVEEGRLEELLERKGKFHEYWEAQKSHVKNFLEDVSVKI